MKNNVMTGQINQCLDLLKHTLEHDLLGLYLYGSAVYGGLQKYSDIDLFVVSERSTTTDEKQKLAAKLLEVSGLYMAGSKFPIELTIVVKSEVNPWYYPPKFDFQYGEWLRKDFEKGTIEPWPDKVMPDLALLITQVLLSHQSLFGSKPDEVLCPVPYRDFILATSAELKNLMAGLHTDTRNVLLTCARIWCTLETDAIRSKPAAALWAVKHLPHEYRPVLNRARSICMGDVDEHWNDITPFIKPCADLMLTQINNQIMLIERSDETNKSIHLDHPSKY